MAAFSLGPGEQATFVFGGADDDRVAVENTDLLFAETLHYWQLWSARSNYRGRWREMVNRSALALKLLTSARHGSIAAAATFGLPETPGGGTQLGLSRLLAARCLV